MKAFLLIFIFSFIIALNPNLTYAQETTLITNEEVESNNTSESCYAIFENKVYDITDYLQAHEDRFMPIDEWCGKDMTEDFKDKAGLGRDHTGGYTVLEKYYIGDLAVNTEESEVDVDNDTDKYLMYGGLGTIAVLGAAGIAYVVVKRS